MYIDLLELYISIETLFILTFIFFVLSVYVLHFFYTSKEFFKTYFQCNVAAVQRSCKINELVHPFSDGLQQMTLISLFILCLVCMECSHPGTFW